MPIRSPNDLVRAPAAEAMLWLEEWLKQGNKINVDADTNWLGLAESAAAYACNTFGKHTVLESVIWGSIAITIREEIAKAEAGRRPSLDDAMTVRYNLIMRFGNHPRDPICDSKIIVEWFYRELSMSLEEATCHAQNWNQQSKREFTFKLLVQRLDMLRSLVASKRLDVDSELERWLSVLELVHSSENKTAKRKGVRKGGKGVNPEKGSTHSMDSKSKMGHP